MRDDVGTNEFLVRSVRRAILSNFRRITRLRAGYDAVSIVAT
jgi:hypothetical protein